MFNQLAGMLSPIVDSALSFFSFMQSHQFILALLSGLLMPLFITLRPEEHEKAPVWKKFILVFAMLSFIFGTLAPLATWFLQSVYQKSIATIPALEWSMILILTVAGLAFNLLLRRLLTPELDKVKRKMVKRTGLERDVRTDVRNVKALLPETTHYDPMDYIDLKKGIFIGLDKDKQPQYIPLKDWQKQHADIIGTTGAGKGVASGILLYQSILAGEGVFVLDPKNDEWAPHLYRKACEDAGKPFVLIDLNKSDYQLNLIEGISAEHLEELFVAGFSLAEKGEAADFYRIDDRKAARLASQLVNENPKATIRDVYNSNYVQSIGETIKAFHGKTEELALLNCINAPEGFSLKQIFDEGGCCYVIGSLRNSKIITTQRMMLVRLFQIAELRDRVTDVIRPIAIFLDELKYHLSKPALEGLGAARDKGIHIIMAHQSIADLRDCPADLNGDAVVGAVVENAKFKLVYKLQDPDTADWVARMSGTILVDDESRKAKINGVLAETIDNERMIRQAERYYIDTNMLQNLPDFVSFIFTTKALPRASLISPLKVKKQALTIFSVTTEQASLIPQVKKALDFDDSVPTQKSVLPPPIIFESKSSPDETPIKSEPLKSSLHEDKQEKPTSLLDF
ncbi:type IV secretion system DNA-binding domain-containing protein [Providencia vermicola]|uniref:type IV secretory system conjugative DNA transfer family protein n=1 Tax=Providencia vermicola TaxID=333965 RepID=UPI0032DB9883